jgi:hypothetical protein
MDHELYEKGLREDIEFVLRYLSVDELFELHKFNRENKVGWEEYPCLKSAGVYYLKAFLTEHYGLESELHKKKGNSNKAKEKKVEVKSARIIIKDDRTDYLKPEDYDAMIDFATMTNDIEWRNELLMKASGMK